jgi:hypothetical protein
MSAQASIDVQFKPFRLSLIRGIDGQWGATLRMGDDALPLVVANAGRDSAPFITLAAGAPRLQVGTATFALPTKQLQRVRGWIGKQNVVVIDEPAVAAAL